MSLLGTRLGPYEITAKLGERHGRGVPSDRFEAQTRGRDQGAARGVLVCPFAAEGRVKPRTTLGLGWRTELERKLKARRDRVAAPSRRRTLRELD
jgi:hypothetical protein